nr:hypothetical protein [Tanacetum cinerariifolium]
KNVSKDLFPKSTEFNADDYAVLVSRPSLFWKFLKPFLCLTGISRYHTLDEVTYPTFLCDNGMGGCLLMCIVQHVANPTKVKVGERECVEGGSQDFGSTVRCVVLLLLVAPTHAESKLEASVERLFNEGSSVNQVDSTTGGGQEAEKRQAITDAGGSFHPPKKLRGTTELLANMRLVPLLIGVTAMQTLPMVTSLVNATPEHEIGDSIIKFDVVPLVITEAVVTSHAVDIPLVLEMGVKVTSLVRASLFQDSDSTETVKVDTAGPFYFARKDLLMGSRELNSKTLHQICEMEYNHLLTEFNVGTARQACLNTEVRMRTEYCLREKKRSKSECEKQADLLKVTKKRHASEIDALKQKNTTLENKNGSFDEKFAQLQSLVSSKDLVLKELNAIVSSFRSQKDGLVSQVHELDVTCSGLRERLFGYDNLKDRLEEFQDAQLKVVNDKVAKLDADLAEMACHLEEKFYPHLLTTISNRSRSIEKKMQDGLAAGIDHCKEGRSMTDVAAYNPSMEADFNSTLQELRPLANAPGMGDLQHDIEQLKVLVHRFEDHVVLGETSLSFDLNVSHSCMEQIRANITAECIPDATVTTMILSTTFVSPSSIPPITVDDYEIVQADGQEIAQGNVQGNAATIEFEKEDLDTTPEHKLLCYTYFVTVLPCFLYCFCISRPLFSQYWACNTSYVLELIVRASVTSYGPSHLGPSLPPSSAWLASLFWTCEISSSQFLILSSNRALIPSPKLLFSLSTKPLSCGCLTKVKHWRIHSFPHQSLNGLSMNCFSLSDIISPGGQSWWTQSCLVHLLFCSPPRYLFDGEFFESVGERPAIKASYSASLLVAFNLNLRAYVNSVPFGFVIIRPALEQSMYDDPSMKSIYGSERSSLSPMGISGGSSPGRSIMKSTRSVP